MKEDNNGMECGNQSAKNLFYRCLSLLLNAKNTYIILLHIVMNFDFCMTFENDQTMTQKKSKYRENIA